MIKPLVLIMLAVPSDIRFCAHCARGWCYCSRSLHSLSNPPYLTNGLAGYVVVKGCCCWHAEADDVWLLLADFMFKHHILLGYLCCLMFNWLLQ